MKLFKEIYRWSLNSKLYMGIYFVTFIVVISSINLYEQIPTLEIMTVFQALSVSVVLAFSQTAILNETTDYRRGIYFARSLSWLMLSVFVSVSVAVFGQWFSEDVGRWSYSLLGILLFIALSLVLIGLKWDQDAETERLNIALKSYQHNRNK